MKEGAIAVQHAGQGQRAPHGTGEEAKVQARPSGGSLLGQVSGVAWRGDWAAASTTIAQTLLYGLPLV